MISAMFRQPLGFWIRHCPQCMNPEVLLVAASRLGGARP